MNQIKTIEKLSRQELENGMYKNASWHDDFKDSAYIYIGRLDKGLVEGDIMTVFSQYGEIVDLDFKRDEETGKPLGFCFLAYEDQRSTNLAVDNLNGVTLGSLEVIVDHKKDYFKLEKKKPSATDDIGSTKGSDVVRRTGDDRSTSRSDSGARRGYDDRENSRSHHRGDESYRGQRDDYYDDRRDRNYDRKRRYSDRDYDRSDSPSRKRRREDYSPPRRQ